MVSPQGGSSLTGISEDIYSQQTVYIFYTSNRALLRFSTITILR